MLNIPQKVKDAIAWTTFVLFMLAAAFYFFYPSNSIGPEDFNSQFLYYVVRYRIAIPAILLALSGLFILPWQMVFAFMFCAVGDIMGAADNFFGQMAFYIVVQVAFAAMFAHLIWPLTMLFGYAGSHKIREYISLPILIIALICFFFVLFVIVPVAVGPTMKFGVTVYSAVLIEMTLLSIALADKYKFPIAAIGGLLFFISDLILGCQKFLFPEFNARWFVMVPYYLAILSIAFSVYKLRDR